MTTKGPVPSKHPVGAKVPLVETPIKKKKSKKRRAERSKPVQKTDEALTAMAMSILDEIGRCPISMEPMRRPVLPSSGQAYDEINIVRYGSQESSPKAKKGHIPGDGIEKVVGRQGLAGF